MPARFDVAYEGRQAWLEPLDLRITGIVRAGVRWVSPCDQPIHVGDRLIGDYAVDPWRGPPRLHLGLTGSAARSIAKIAVANRRSTSGPAKWTGRSGWELDTTHMKPRAYTLTLALPGRSLVTLDFRLAPRSLALIPRTDG